MTRVILVICLWSLCGLVGLYTAHLKAVNVETGQRLESKRKALQWSDEANGGIGIQIEEPFSILPLEALCEDVQTAANDMVAGMPSTRGPPCAAARALRRRRRRPRIYTNIYSRRSTWEL